MHRPQRTAARSLAAVAVVAAALVMSPGTAVADVQVTPSQAEAGARDVTITFRVTNDDPAVSTTRLRVLLPTARPLLGVSPGTPDGWTVRLSTAAPPTPEPAGVAPATEVVTAIEWDGGPLTGDDVAVFPVAVGRLPDGAGPLRFRAVQTFANGTTAEWSDEAPYGAPAPAHPSLVVPYAGTAALPPEAGHHHGGATAADLAVAAREYGSGGWTVGLAAAVAASVIAGVVWSGRRQRRRFAALRAAATRDGRSVEHVDGEPAAAPTRTPTVP
jgi:Domain of unkown function (DUF1775)